MSVDIRKLEIERLENLIKGFGWDKVEERHTDIEVIITIKKKLPLAEGGPSPPPG